MMGSSPILHAALQYADLGFPVFPCVPGQKRPLTANGLKDATNDSTQIDNWWADVPDANVAIRTDDLLVIDIDSPGDTWLGDLDERWLSLDVAPCSQTPRGGRHFIFRQPAGKAWRNTAGRLAEGIDTRGNGGYIVAPPSVVGSRAYRWIEGHELAFPIDELPLPPPWLVEQLDHLGRTPQKVTALGISPNVIPEGRRDTTLTSLAGTMRRVGMTEVEIAAALRRVNADRCRPPLSHESVDRIAASVARYEPDELSAAILGGAWPPGSAAPPFEPHSIRELMATYDSLREPVVHGLVRNGETMNVISLPKLGKTWLVTDLGLSIAVGIPWLGTFETVPGDVLVLDNELHSETSAHRIPKVAEARGIPLDSVADHLFVQNLRGQLMDILGLEPFLRSIEPGRFKVIILDAFYRFMPPNTDENDNGAMTRLYNCIDRYADRLACSFILIHHTTKGSQSGKSVTDVGAGAGSQSRATDTHLILRPHEEPDAVVLDAAVRSWPPVSPRCLRWAFPVWTPADDLDPTRLRPERPRRKADAAVIPPGDGPAPQADWSPERFAETFVVADPRSRTQVLAAAHKAGLSDYKAERFLRHAEALGLIHRWDNGRNRPISFALVAQPRLPAAPAK